MLSVWISQDGHYAFVEFRSIADSEECKDIGRLRLLGRDLRVGKTKQANIGNAQCGPDPTFTEQAAFQNKNENSEDLEILSRTLIVNDILDLSKVKSDKDFVDIEKDIKLEC